MSKSNQAKNKTETCAKSRLISGWGIHLLLLCVPGISFSDTAAQQGSPVRPSATSTPLPASPRKAIQPATSKTKGRVREILVDSSIPDDPSVEKLLTPYVAKVRALEIVIGKLDGDLKKASVGGGNLGNFVTDGIRIQSSAKVGKPVLLAVTNSGGLRKNTIAAGDLRVADIFELLPFENALVKIDLTGEELLKLLSVVVSSGDAWSGARINIRMNEKKPEMVSARLLNANGGEMEIDPKATYSLVTIDYLMKLGGGRYSILQSAKNITPLGVTLRDALMDYVKNETAAGRQIRAALDDRFVIVTSSSQNSASQ
jgi:2',3'-cyclic-nucleotide 2'-phosphodiesterase (5'-nucleotidase family)